MPEPENPGPTSELEVFFDLSLDLLCIAGLDGRFRRVNPSFERLLGYSPEELLARPFIDLVHPDDRRATLQEIQKLARGTDTVRFLNRYRCKDGSWRWLSWTCPAPTPGSELLYATARDVTDQLAAEEELRIRDSILESMQHGLLITDARQPDNPIIHCNDAFLTLTGYTREEVIGRNCRFLQNGDNNQEQLPYVRECIREGIGCRALLRNYRKDGSLFWNELTLGPVLDEHRKVTHFVGLQNDVTELTQANQQRWQKLAERVATLPPRQRELMDLLVAGEHTKSIARKMGISPKTVEGHRTQLLANMEVASVIELVRLVLTARIT